MIDGTVVVVHVAMPNVEINLGVDEVDIVSQSSLAELFVNLLLVGARASGLSL